MSEDQTPLWRQAIQDKSHPLNAAAWLLFNGNMNTKYAAKRLTEQKEAVIELIKAIMDDYEVLMFEDSLGSGYAPANAVKLIGAWQIKSYLPLLLDFIRDEEPEDYLHNNSEEAIKNFGPEIIPDILAYQEENEDAPFMYISTIFMLSAIGKKNEQAFDYIYKRFQHAEGDDIEITATALLECDVEKALPIIEEWMSKNQRKLNKRLKTVMPKLLQDARDGNI